MIMHTLVNKRVPVRLKPKTTIWPVILSVRSRNPFGNYIPALTTQDCRNQLHLLAAVD